MVHLDFTNKTVSYLKNRAFESRMKTLPEAINVSAKPLDSIFQEYIFGVIIL
jgi:hypothetical protein